VNTWVNPWRVTPMPWTSAKFEEYRGIDQSANRTSKAGLARSGQWDAAIFGSSRANIGFNPEDPAWGNLHAVNLGLYAGNIDENEAMFDYFMATQSPKLVVFLVDAGDLTKPDPTSDTADFATSPLVSDGRPLERELRYHVGITALSASLQTWKRELNHQPEAHSPRGYRRTLPHQDSAQMASLYLIPLLKTAAERAQLDGINPGKLQRLRDIIATCRAKNTRLVFVLPPNHVTYQLAFPELKNPDPYFTRDRGALAEVVAAANHQDPAATPVELWDFLDAHPLNAPALPLAKGAQMENWVDLFHFKPAIGAEIMRRIQGAAGDYGVRLTPENIDARLEQVTQGLTSWGDTHPDDLTFLRKSLHGRDSAAPEIAE
jgi:hypothetical protein